LNLLTDVEGDVTSVVDKVKKVAGDVKKDLEDGKTFVLRFSKEAVKHVL